MGSGFRHLLPKTTKDSGTFPFCDPLTQVLYNQEPEAARRGLDLGQQGWGGGGGEEPIKTGLGSPITSALIESGY